MSFCTNCNIMLNISTTDAIFNKWLNILEQTCVALKNILGYYKILETMKCSWQSKKQNLLAGGFNNSFAEARSLEQVFVIKTFSSDLTPARPEVNDNK